MVDVQVQVNAIVGSLLSVQAILEREIRFPCSVSGQGLPVLASSGGVGSPFEESRSAETDEAIRSCILEHWRQGWCDYHEAKQTRGRPPSRAVYHVHVSANPRPDLSSRTIHRIFGVVMVREATRGRFVVIVNEGGDVLESTILLHPVALNGRLLRFDKDFFQRLKDALSLPLLSARPEEVVRIWSSC